MNRSVDPVQWHRHRIERFRAESPASPSMGIMDFELVELLDEIERLRAVIDESPLTLRGMIEKRGSATTASIQASGKAVVALATECRWILQDAKNFVELRFNDDLGDMVVTLQKVEGKTPKELLAEGIAGLRDELKEARAERDAAMVTSERERREIESAREEAAAAVRAMGELQATIAKQKAELVPLRELHARARDMQNDPLVETQAFGRGEEVEASVERINAFVRALSHASGFVVWGD